MLSLCLAVLAGFLAGIVSGLGVGGGTILMVYLTAVTGLGQRTAQGINLLFFLPTAGAALILHSKNRFVEWRALLPAALCGCLAAAGFSLLAMRMDLGLLKKLFGGFLIVTGLSELLRRS